MNILKKDLLNVLKATIFTLFLICGCKKDNVLPKLTFPDYDTIINNYIQLNQKKLKAVTVNQKPTALIYPYDHSLEEYTLECRIKDISDTHNIFIGKGNGGLLLVNNSIFITDNKSNIIYSGGEITKDVILIEINKDLESITYMVNNKIIKKFNISDQSSAVLLRGKPIVAGWGGTYTISHISLTTWKDPDYFIIGDSLIEGGAILQNGLSIHNKWTNLLKRNLPNTVFAIDGLGGESLGHISAKRVIEEINAINPQNVIIQFGTNNTSYDEYIRGINLIKSSIKSKIYLSTCTLRPAPYYNNNKKINEWILSQTDHINLLGTLYVDDAIISEYFFADTFHPNILGNQKIESVIREMISSK